MEKRAFLSVVMSDFAPSKRRKTKASSAMTPEQGKLDKACMSGIRLTMESYCCPPVACRRTSC
jgi:hypothetical protein